jgi:hypothetical protein
MLTPAEELGLSGLSLASRVRKAFFHIPDSALLQLTERMRDEAKSRHLSYFREGQEDPIHVMPMPMTLLPEQVTYIHHVTLTIQNALKRFPELYLQDEGVRGLLRIPPEEESWLRECWGPSQRENNPIFGRLDAMVDFISPMWKDSLKFVEPNLGGIGGLHLVPTAEHIVADLVLPILRAQDPALELELGRDIRELLMQEILDHLQALGRSAEHICFIDPKYVGIGPDEQEALAHYYHERHGLKIMHADPSELTLSKGEVYFQGEMVDLVYRDYAVADLLNLERKGINVEPMKLLLKQNRVMSSIAAELDQKSCWEVLTDPEYTQKYFRAEERQVFRRHILWTRIVSDRNTQLPDGQTAGLLGFIRKNQESLVLKPNRAYGGEGVLIGHLMDSRDWEAALDRALADADRWVVQELASIPVSEFPLVGPDGKVYYEPFYTVMGFASTQYGMSILGRASQKQVVNVAQRGGMCVLMMGRPPATLHGPALR